jgi:hypothetical protein
MGGDTALQTIGKSRAVEVENFPNVFLREALQATIRRYSWQSVAVRLASIAVVVWFFTHLPMGSINPQKVTITVWPVICLFLLWIWEGHIKFLQSKYCEKYREANLGNEVELSFPVPKGFNVSGLWIPTVVMNYAVLIGLCALVILGF